MKYICNNCSKEFNESEENKQIKSLFIRQLIIECPFCLSHLIGLTKLGNLLVTRRAKIKKIENINEE